MLKVIAAALLIVVSTEVQSHPRSPQESPFPPPPPPPPVSFPQFWNPLTWWLPIGIAQAETWSSYLKQAQKASNRLYRLFQSYIRRVALVNRQQQETTAGGLVVGQAKRNKTAKVAGSGARPRTTSLAVTVTQREEDQEERPMTTTDQWETSAVWRAAP